jgi:periplasmic protein CpxP/Spy
MTKIKVLTISVIALVAVNISLIIFIMLGPAMHRPKHEGPKSYITKKLNFDKAQEKAYDNLIIQHQQSIQEEENQAHTLKKALYSNLRSDSPSNLDSIYQQLSEVQIKMEEIHFMHFLEIRKLCRKDQIPAFDELSNELEELFSRKPPRRNKND